MFSRQGDEIMRLIKAIVNSYIEQVTVLIGSEVLEDRMLKLIESVIHRDLFQNQLFCFSCAN